MKKNALTALLIAGAMLAVTACGTTTASQPAATAPAETTAAATTAAETTVAETKPEETTAAETTAAETTAAETTAAETTAAETTAAAVASGSETIAAEEVIDENMTPIAGSAIKDGTYDINIASSSSMFKVNGGKIDVKDGQITVTMTMGGSGNTYPYLFPGKADEAAAADESQYIKLNEEADGSYTFTFPVEALNKALPFAAFSKNKEKWYDRDLAFKADALPADAFSADFFTTAESLQLADGEYEVDAQLTGGSGKTTVASPAAFTVKDGKAEVTVVMSSSKYDYAIVDGVKYEPSTTEPGSTFTFPISAFDYPMPFIGDTVAMGSNHEIEYTIYFDSKTIQAKGGAAQAEAPAAKTAAELNIADGSYTAEIVFEGGSGKSYIESPVNVDVKDGKVTATVVWSSSKYDYMLVDGQKYEPTTLEPGSTFEIPVAGFDAPLTMIGDTTAMSKPHEVEYQVTFDSASLQERK